MPTSTYKVKKLYLCIVQRNTAVASSHTPHNRTRFSTMLVYCIAMKQSSFLSHTQRHDWLTAGNTDVQLVTFCHVNQQFSFIDLSMTLFAWVLLFRNFLPAHGVEQQTSLHCLVPVAISCYLHACKILTFLFPRWKTRTSSLVPCLNHWNEYSTTQEFSSVRKAAATKACQQWHATKT